MSSLIGHSLAGLTVGITNQQSRFLATSWARLLWIFWLVVIEIAPDLDYVVPFLHPSANAGLRITHSLSCALLLPTLTVIGLRGWGCDRKSLFHATAQLAVASLSHMGLDLVVGVTALPILWPISNHVFKLPFGLLPSAGKPSLSNYYFYYNLGIEMGALVPLSCGLLISQYKRLSVWRWGIISLLLSVSAYFMHWAYGLSR
ncbi:hypothetical protein [Acaryochloris sp. IP29b_bin.148]|uniref:hypothetical protein n=1 Tax=Acaryochloris sp. IP29b_bin.148 TaxID=2969218 RepID=UPI0026397652|nr:hypothetical protein [Acaryochloris sp. IP29b_bin.148]